MVQKILVTGATGTQGGAVIDHLLSGDYGEFDVYGLTRDATSDTAQALEARGVTVVQGEMTDADAMAEAVAGMDGVYLVTTFFEDGPEVETEQGVTVVDAATTEGIGHLVYSSVGSADANTGLAHFDSKWQVEQHIHEVGVPATIVRPVFFMQNLEYMAAEQIRHGELSLPMAEGRELAMVHADDIGHVVAMAFADPETFAGETITLAGDSLPLAEAAAVLTDAIDHEVTPVYLDIGDYREQMGDEMADMFQWFNDVGYDIDVEALEADYGIETRDFATYLSESDAWKPAGTPVN